jgi:hypothetical protein
MRYAQAYGVRKGLLPSVPSTYEAESRQQKRIHSKCCSQRRHMVQISCRRLVNLVQHMFLGYFSLGAILFETFEKIPAHYI